MDKRSRLGVLRYPSLLLSRHSSLDPGLEDPDLGIRPSAVAGHRAVPEALQDGLAVPGNLVARPEIEGELHRLTIAFAEQRPDVLLEADRVAVCGHEADCSDPVSPATDQRFEEVCGE
jgi:hypothetical protein